jgi:hypothetical protein
MQLVDAKTGKPVKLEDTVTDFRGKTAIVKGMVKPQHDGSTGRVVVSHDGYEMHHEYYPSVYGLKWDNASET